LFFEAPRGAGTWAPAQCYPWVTGTRPSQADAMKFLLKDED